MGTDIIEKGESPTTGLSDANAGDSPALLNPVEVGAMTLNRPKMTLNRPKMTAE
jgi:hypothetical protein